MAGAQSDLQSTTSTRCGFAALIGAPNAGKSTLMNALLGTKVSIVTPKVQTTRSRVLGIEISGDAQIVYVDTPGIFAPKRRLDRAMVAAAWQGAGDADVICLLVDTERYIAGRDRDTAEIIQKLRDTKRRAHLLLNKIDLVKKEELLALAETFVAENVFNQVFMISALKGDGIDDLRTALAAAMPQGPWLFPEDQLSDMPDRLLAAEITREKLFLDLHQELPYSLTVETEAWENQDDGSARINQVIYVERAGHKGIVLGKGGAQIKRVGAASRRELEDLLGRHALKSRPQSR
jgi:GTP-binding protein Era